MALPRFKKLILLLIPLAILFGVWQSWPKAPQPAVMQLAPEPTPSPAPTTQTAESIDGKIQLSLTFQAAGNQLNWTLISQTENGSPKTIWNETLPTEIQVVLPFNTVSPDNKYLFLTLNGEAGSRYLALAVTGSPAVEFSGPFYNKYPEWQITDVTGWGGINLIIINTDDLTGATGPSFWYEAPTQAFIRLANRFN